jgi:GntR family transcriptional regulator
VTVLIEVDTASAVPAYEQIRAQIETMVGSGLLPPGTPLPPIRQLAADLGLAVNTVARAYRELEHNGVVIGRVRHGTVVAEHATERLSTSETRRRLAAAAATYALAVKQLGVSATDAIEVLSDQLNPSEASAP